VYLGLSSFGCLDWINFLFFGSHGFHMGGNIAVAGFPFKRGIRSCSAVSTGWIFRGSLASIAFINDGKAMALIKAASFGGHENTVIAFSYGSTNHNTRPV
jgi:hypothetical protein